MEDDIRYSNVTVRTNVDPYRDVLFKDTPGLKGFLRRMDLGCQVLDMRKRSFLFFKRSLKPHERAKAYALLLMEDMETK